MVLRAREIMTRRVVTVSPDSPLELARIRLSANRFGTLPVVDDRHRLVGVVTAADLLAADRSPTGAAPATVGAVMTPDPLRMTPDADVAVLAHRLRTYGDVRAMPIVENGMLVGIVTRGDLLRLPPPGGRLGRWLRRSRRRPPAPRDPWADEPRRGTTVAGVMTPAEDVWAVSETTPVADAARCLADNRFTLLPVVDDDDRLVGVVGEADLVPDRLSGRRSPARRTVGEAMTTDVTTAGPDDDLADVVHAMLDGRFRTLPVVDRDGRVAGVVSRGDLLRSRAPRPERT